VEQGEIEIKDVRINPKEEEAFQVARNWLSSEQQLRIGCVDTKPNENYFSWKIQADERWQFLYEVNCANAVRKRRMLETTRLTPATKAKDHPTIRRERCRVTDVRCKPGQLLIGTGGLLQVEMHGRLRRNSQYVIRERDDQPFVMSIDELVEVNSFHGAMRRRANGVTGRPSPPVFTAS